MQTSVKQTDLPKVEKSGAGLPMPFARIKLNVTELGTPPATVSGPLQPPPSMTSAPKSCESNKELNDASTVCETSDVGNSLELVMKTLRDINESLVSTDSSKVEEIEKRLNILQAMWTDGKLDDKLKVLLVTTAKGKFLYFMYIGLFSISF